MIPKKISVKEVGGVPTLHVNEQPAPCPFRNPFLMPPSFQGAPIQMSVPTCSDACHFFRLTKIPTAPFVPGGYEVKLYCSAFTAIVQDNE